ncbi:MAG: RecQ family ATP-dependent DNA helicase [Lentimicrobium sp.]|nr:RecQ family ATP-dependent DNA helicase [Lentimicrobium sp.]
MKPIVYFDTEIDAHHKKIRDIGAVNENGSSFHSANTRDFINFIRGAEFLCGHNAIKHDLIYTRSAILEAGVNPSNIIDTLALSPLLFPARPYHALLKDDKLQTDELSNPVNDSKKARELFHDEVSAFERLDDQLKRTFYLLLNEQKQFKAFFLFLDFYTNQEAPDDVIRNYFHGEICENANLPGLISEHPVELAYTLALINARNRYSITPPWVLKNYPYVERTMHLLRNTQCLIGCPYCFNTLDVNNALKKYFGFNSYRTFAGESLQEKAVKAAVAGDSLLAVFPTGGGKSITFQVPALLAGETTKGLTVIISPLQSLMKDQVDNLEKSGITDAVTINGLLDPIERAKSIERVEDGSASILYISPESLRSRTIEHMILGRTIARFVIDEAHCFSSWGQDFRVDYLYIGDFIRMVQNKKNLEEKIPVSCFTATAKQKVIEDISAYFREKLSLSLTIFTSKASRTNLHFKVFEKGNEEEKYYTVRDLIEDNNCPTIIYVSRTRKAYELATRLTKDGYSAKPYHGKMDAKEKSENQDAFIAGTVNIMVATSAFGMGVDKKDVGMVIHYEISDSLENYIQEAGRAGRDESITAECYILFNEEDLSKHFILLNQTKLNINEIKQIWNAIKFITRFRIQSSHSALEIARKAGWDENINEIETRVTTAIAALEDAGYVERGQNMPRIYANSILSKTAQDAIEKIKGSNRFLSENQKINAIRIIKKLFSTKSRKHANDENPESRVDYISDHLGIVREDVISIINILREENILADTKDLTAYIRKGENANRSLSISETYRSIELFLIDQFEELEKTFSLKALKQLYEHQGNAEVPLNYFRIIINFWAIKHWIKRQTIDYSRNHMAIIARQPKNVLGEKLRNRHLLARFITEYLFTKSITFSDEADANKEEELVEFSVHELKSAFENQNLLFENKITIEDIEDSLFYLSRIEAIKIEGGFLVVYNRLTINRLEQNNRVQYKTDDYQKLNQFYENKVQQIHIVGEYAKKMLDDYKEALVFVDDYFRLNYSAFLNKYFPGSRQSEIKRNVTPAKYRQLFGTLSPVQREIIDDKDSKYIVVAAGPGSGKTKVLVHKLASLLLMEDVKHEQLLMVTFSRAAATEFKKRLMDLIGNAAAFIEIKTFHSFCFDLLGKIGNIEHSETILKSAIEKITNNEIELSRITKTVLVIDEAQDMNADEYALINLLMTKNDDMRIIAVGDDDQNIYSFRGSDSRYLSAFICERQAKKYELNQNFRSKRNLVEFTNHYVETIGTRLKTERIASTHSESGQIKLAKHNGRQLISPMVEDVFTAELSGTTCILTQTNDEALHITGLLIQKGVRAKLIQNSDEFNLYNLYELRCFLGLLERKSDSLLLGDDDWGMAKKEIVNQFSNSTKLEPVVQLIKDFEAINPRKKFKSDLEVFIRESKIEDFYSGNSETIIVSTMHKAKGKEFDNVFILLDHFDHTADDKKRLLYVAMTRARSNLTIHYNHYFPDQVNVDGLIKSEDITDYKALNEFSLHLSHRDLNLGYFGFVQPRIDKLYSGDKLIFHTDELRNLQGQPVLKFSKKFIETLDHIRSTGFRPTDAEVNFIVYWKNEKSENEVKILLPAISFGR